MKTIDSLPIVKARSPHEMDFGYIGEMTGANYDGIPLQQFATAAGMTVKADLTNIARAYRPQDQTFIADQVAPVTPVDVESGRYSAFGKEGFDIDVSDNLADDANAGTILWSADKVSWSSDPRGLQTFLPDRIARIRGAVRAESIVTKLLTQALMRRQEVRVRNLADATSNTSTPGTDWDISTSHYSDVETAQQVMQAALGLRANTIALGDHIVGETLGALKADIAAATALPDGRAVPGFMGPGGVDRLFQMRLLQPNVFYGSAAPGLARVLARVWGDDGYMFHIDTETETATWAVQLSYLEPTIVTWRDEARGMGGTWYKMFVQRKEIEITPEAVLKLVDLT